HRLPPAGRRAGSRRRSSARAAPRTHAARAARRDELAPRRPARRRPMAMQPNRSKFRKVHRGRVRGTATRGHTVAFGDYGLQTLDAAWISGRQIEAGRVAANRAMNGQGKVWIRVFPHKPVSGKPAETRMGTGKG